MSVHEGYDFLFLADEDIPALVLAINNDGWDEEYEFKEGRKWQKIQHQTAGYACHQHFLLGTILTPKDHRALHRLCKRYDDSCLAQPASLEAILEYRSDLKELLDADCETSYWELEEGYYPIDATHENLQKLCTDELPGELDDLIKWRNDIQKLFGFIGRWRLYVLGDNCD